MRARHWFPVAVALAVVGCEPKKGETTPPDESASGGSAGSGSAASSTRRSSNPDCPASGPSVSINVRRPSEGATTLASDELGGLLGWIGGFVQPCINEPSKAHHITLVFKLGEKGQAATFEFVEREELPGMAQCLDEGFATAGEPPPGPMDVSIVVPWGCPTLGPGFDAASMAGTPAEDEEPESGEAAPEPSGS